MKKLIISFSLVFILLCSNVFADERIVPASSLPQKATTFLNQYFKDIDITYVEEDRDDFEVNLSNGIEVTFMKNGDWDQVDARYQTIPTGFIPQPILDTIKTMYENVYIISIEKDWAGFEVELSNRFELKIDKNGKVHEIDYDD